jgi:hypothetical protein
MDIIGAGVIIAALCIVGLLIREHMSRMKKLITGTHLQNITL